VPERLLLEGENLPELMARVRDELGPRATIVGAERVRDGGVAGFFARERYELTVEVPSRAPSVPAGTDPLEALLDAADRAEVSGTILAPPEVSTTGARFAAVLEGVRALAGDGAPAVPIEKGSRPVLVDQVLRPIPGDEGPRPEPADGRPWGRTAAALVTAGVPAAMLDGSGSLADVLDRIPLPPPVPRRAGQVLVVVGPLDGATAVASILRLQWGLPEAAVVDVRAAGLTSTGALVRWRVRSTEAPHPWVLVVGVADDRTGRALAAGLVAAAQADRVWAVVDARTKLVDASRWLEQIGGARRPDALAVLGLLDTGDPGTVLALGSPVAWADGIPASRALWGTVLGQCVEQAAAPG
jgi:hypothetical protein